MALLVGAIAPNFTLPGWFHRSTAPYSLAHQPGRVTILCFYPGDERIVCRNQMCAYSQGLGDLHLFDADVWGISEQSIESHQAFAENRHLKMPLLVDTDNVVAQQYGVIGPLGVRRSVFIIDREGRIAWRWISTLNLRYPRPDQILDVLVELGRP